MFTPFHPVFVKNCRDCKGGAPWDRALQSADSHTGFDARPGGRPHQWSRVSNSLPTPAGLLMRNSKKKPGLAEPTKAKTVILATLMQKDFQAAAVARSFQCSRHRYLAFGADL